ncbi:helix-turn-helix domain-containing protein [Meiothermus rufus]|uniref:helix-turn-helix domain-containing protein n=1 Tax=Meiothermus rufus TaxID=604332 RepID=UPI000687A407|nr:helix-turn-helix domain-containing protein [Meiothermus rufus]
MQRLALSVEEVAQALGTHKNTVYRAIWRGELRATKVGKRLVIPRAELERVLGHKLENPAEQGGER